MAVYTAEIVDEDQESQEILECLKTLLNIRAGTQPIDRDLGISWDCLDYPNEVAESLFLIELEEKVEKYEPRAEIKEVDFKVLDDGTLQPCILFRRKEG